MKVTDELAAQIMVITEGRMPHELDDASFSSICDNLVRLGHNYSTEEYEQTLRKAQETYRLLSGDP
jgi:hypothetical protein